MTHQFPAPPLNVIVRKYEVVIDQNDVTVLDESQGKNFAIRRQISNPILRQKRPNLGMNKARRNAVRLIYIDIEGIDLVQNGTDHQRQAFEPGWERGHAGHRRIDHLHGLPVPREYQLFCLGPPGARTTSAAPTGSAGTGGWTIRQTARRR